MIIVFKIVEVDVPSHWTPMTSAEKLKLVLLDPSSAEYLAVTKDVNATAARTLQQIVKVCSLLLNSVFKYHVQHRPKLFLHSLSSKCQL